MRGADGQDRWRIVAGLSVPALPDADAVAEFEPLRGALAAPPPRGLEQLHGASRQRQPVRELGGGIVAPAVVGQLAGDLQNA